jgi:beta-lactamase regulating signal transducer with metallopeptidase domain
MMDLLLEAGYSNLCISSALAMVAWTVQSKAKRPQLAYFLWLLVLVKLIIPPLLVIPMIDIPGLPTIPPSSVSSEPLSAANLSNLPGSALIASPDRLESDSFQTEAATQGFIQFKSRLALFWLIGSLGVVFWSLWRVYRFNGLLKLASESAPAELQLMASGIGQSLGLKAKPKILATSAKLSPMVWWIGGRVRIIFPTGLISKMDAKQLRWAMAHELAHVRRGDHWVRWLEWLACAIFWWNPVAWWARRNLRLNEEVCCDALVLSSLKPNRHCYANALLAVVESIAFPALRPPAIASELNSGGILEKRFKMIMSENQILETSRLRRAFVVVCAMVLLPLGVVHAQDSATDAETKYRAIEAKIIAAVEEGQLSKEDAGAKLAAARKSIFGNQNTADARKKKYQRIEVKIIDAVKAGGMSRIDAELKLAALKKEIFAEQEGKTISDAKRIRRLEYARAEIRLKKAVEVGRISAEDARIRLGEMRKRVAEQNQRAEGQWRKTITREDYARVAADLKKRVEAGVISVEDARTRLAEMHRVIGELQASDIEKINREEYARAAIEIKRAVEAGRISTEDGRLRLEGMRKQMAEQQQRGEDQRRRTITREEYEKVTQDLKKKIQAGRISEEYARIRLEKMRKYVIKDEEAGEKRPPTREEMAKVKETIWAHVQSGVITEAQAKARWQAYLERAKR